MSGSEQRQKNISDTADEYTIIPIHGWTPWPVDDAQAEKLSSAELLQLLGAWQESNNVTASLRSENRPLQQLSTLCSHCQNIFKLLPTTSPWDETASKAMISAHYNRERDLQLSAKADCGMCIQLINGCNPEVKPWPHWEDRPEEFTVHESVAMIHRYQSSWKISLRIPVFNGDKDTRIEKHHSLWLESDPVSEPKYVEYLVHLRHAQSRVLYESPEPLASTKDALPLVKEWLNVCQTSHETCNRQHERRFNPTRLIDLSGPEPQLRLGYDIEESARYATLSHCWGTQPFETLTKQSLVQFLRNIPMSAFTKTFRNAIEVVRHMELKYLWIDSLCIIQDDQSDWQSESSMMTDVYGNSALNLAASGAVDGSIGLFFSRRTKWRVQFQVHIGNREQLFECYPGYGRAFLNGPLLYRGWALQERLLPRRTVHFAKSQLFWECHELSTSEMFPYGNPFVYYIDLPKPLLTKHWPEYVLAYSGASLTLSKDKLVAISGVARMISETSKDEYIIGLWQSNMVLQLPWWTLGNSPNLPPRPAPYRAPSWSWASIDAQVLFPRYGAGKSEEVTKYFVEVAGIKVKYLTPSNPFGEVVDATLRLRCAILCRGVLEPSRYRPHVNFRCRISPILLTFMVTFDSLDDFEHFQPDITKALDPREYDSAVEQEVFILPLYAFKYEKLHDRLEVPCLVLLPTYLEQRQYRRIGTCNFSFMAEISSEKAVEDDLLSVLAESGVDDSDYTEMSTNEERNRERFIELI